MNYYTRINRSVSGPISEQELLEQIRAKTISMLDEVSTDGVNWRRLGTLPIYNGVTSAPRQVRGAVAQPEPEVRASGTYHLYCEKCGYEWYSNRWDNYCPKGSCGGHAKRYAVPGANDASAIPEVRSADTNRLYCEKCGHTWYSPRWDDWCPKCGNRGRKYAVPRADGGRAAPSRRKRLLVVAALAVVTVATVVAMCMRNGRTEKNATPPQKPVPAASEKACRRALLVSIGKCDEAAYKKLGWRVGDRGASAEADLRNMENACRKLGGWTDLETLSGSRATVSEIRRRMAAFAERTKPGDIFLLFFSSHGNAEGDDKKNDAILCAYDGPYGEKALAQDIGRFKKGTRPIVILSACHSAAMFEKRQRAGGEEENAAAFDVSAFLERMTSQKRFALSDDCVSASDVGWICSAASDQSSYRTKNESGSIFASYLIAREGWMGGAADGLTAAVVGAHGPEAVSSTKAVLDKFATLRQEPTGQVTFLDLALYAVRKSATEVNRNGNELTQTIPQFANPNVLNAVVAGKTGVLSEFDLGDDDQASPAAVSDDAVSRFLSPPESDLVELFAQIRDSSAVTGNPKYQHVANGVDCHVVEDDSLNAYAHWKRLPSGARIREICYHSGHARFDRVVGAIASKSYNEGENSENQRAQAMVALISELPRTLRAHRYRISAETAASLLKSAGIDDADFARPGFLEKARKVADGIALSTFSHELGHHLLGHLDGDWQSSTNKVFSRAQEEQADLFSTQVMAAADTREDRQQIFMGRFLWCFIVASTERGDSDEDRSHPATRRRLRSLIEADPATAREFGLNTDMIDKMLAAVAAIQGNAGNSASTAP